MDAYVHSCRRVLAEGGNSDSRGFFDQAHKMPDFASLRYFEVEPAIDWLKFYLVYVEVHLDPDRRSGSFSVYTLETGAPFRSSAAQSQVQILPGQNDLLFETADDCHHLEGGAVVERDNDGGVTGFSSVKFELSLISLGTKQTTRTLKAKSARLESTAIEIPCPKCCGKGEFFDMAIPEASMKSGLSGYALYSENTICSYTGCTLCGGSGVAYRDWYVKERGIDMRGLAPLQKGRGRIAIAGAAERGAGAAGLLARMSRKFRKRR